MIRFNEDDEETLYPCGQHMSWKSWQVLEGAFTPAISSVRDTIFLLILKIHDLVVEGIMIIISSFLSCEDEHDKVAIIISKRR